MTPDEIRVQRHGRLLAWNAWSFDVKMPESWYVAGFGRTRRRALRSADQLWRATKHYIDHGFAEHPEMLE